MVFSLDILILWANNWPPVRANVAINLNNVNIIQSRDLCSISMKILNKLHIKIPSYSLLLCRRPVQWRFLSCLENDCWRIDKNIIFQLNIRFTPTGWEYNWLWVEWLVSDMTREPQLQVVLVVFNMSRVHIFVQIKTFSQYDRVSV